MENPEVSESAHRPVPTPSRQDSAPSADASLDSDVEVVESAGPVNEVPLDDAQSQQPLFGVESPAPTPAPTELDPPTASTDLDPPTASTGDQGDVEATLKVPSDVEDETPYGDEDEDEDEKNGCVDIPRIDNAFAPRFSPREHHISPNAIRQRTKRIFTKRVDGTMKVSETIFNEWKGKGQARKNLEQIFKSCGYDAVSCFCHGYIFLSAPEKTSNNLQYQPTITILISFQ